MTIDKIFKIISEALKEEHKELSEAQQKFHYKPSDELGCGIADLEEKHIQYILYKALLKHSHLFVSYEEPYKETDGNCDLVLFDDATDESLWLEIKAHGYCSDGEYKKWSMQDIVKLKALRKEGAHKYCLITALEDDLRPDVREWKEWFDRNLPEVIFDVALFDFFETRFTDKKKFLDGYYSVCLLKI